MNVILRFLNRNGLADRFLLSLFIFETILILVSLSILFQREPLVDESANSTTPYITAPCKAGANLTLPAPAACIVNTGITSCVEPAITAGMKKVGHKYVDQCIDTEAKKVIDQSIDSSVDSTKSFLTMICDYVQSKFA